MRLDIAQKLIEPEDRRVVWSHADAPEVFDELHLKGDLVAQVLVSPEGTNKCLVTGTISGVQTLTCVRSLEPFDRPFETEMTVEVERVQVASQELDDEDEEIFAYKIPQTQGFVDLRECVRQLVLLQEPQAPVKIPTKILSLYQTIKPAKSPKVPKSPWTRAGTNSKLLRAKWNTGVKNGST